MNSYPVLYTFRRCPYAIRARMALEYAKIRVSQYEVDLKNKPQEMVNSSKKATVPVLVLEDGRVIDESIDIMFWALEKSDPDGWLSQDLRGSCDQLIYINDAQFKPILDKYKYSQNSEERECYKENAKEHLNQLNSLLMQNDYLLSEHISYADIAIFPFIRQFYMVDQKWFKDSGYQCLQNWLRQFLESDVFQRVMKK